MSIVSIITINFNNYLGLKKTISSVVSQTCKEIEYLIIDGGSVDGSVDVITECSGKIDYWASERDNGIYHAMNKGIAKASGEYLLFLNSGDVLVDEKAIEKFSSLNCTADIVYGHLKFQNDFKKEWVPPHKLDFEFFLGSSIAHPSTFIKRELFGKVGTFNEQLKIVSDWKFFMDAICRHNCSYRKLDFALSSFDLSGISSNEELVHKEMFEVITKEYGDFLFSLYKRDHEIVSHVKDSRLISIFKKVGFLSNIKLYNK